MTTDDLTPNDLAQILTGYARNLTRDQGFLVAFVPAQPATDWAGAVGFESHYVLSFPDGRVSRFGTEKTKLASLKARVRKELK